MTLDTLQASNERDGLKASDLHNEARILRNKVVGLIKEAKKVYYHKLIESHQKNSKALWSCLKDLIPTDKTQESIFTSSHRNHITDKAQISNLFNKYILEIIEKYSQKSSTSSLRKGYELE